MRSSQVIAAESVPGVLIDSVHFVENAEVMYQASALGKVKPLTDKEVEGFLHDFKRDRHIPKLWTYYVGRGRDKKLALAERAKTTTECPRAQRARTTARPR